MTKFNRTEETILAAGTFLSSPIKKKDTVSEENDLVAVGQSSMQGWRRTMEDVTVVWLSIPGDTTNTSYFAVFDGHGGNSVSQFAGTFLLHHIMNQTEWKTDLKTAIRKGFVLCDQDLREERDSNAFSTGSTAVTVFMRGNQLYCGNVGDSRAVAYEMDTIIPLSRDHKPSVQSEKDRIVSAGGRVYMDRVNGSLGLSRAFGDFLYKRQRTPPEQQMVSVVPELIVKPVDKKLQFIVIACDGIWEVMTDESVRRFVRTKLFQNNSPAQVAESLMDSCLAPTPDLHAVGCDNMSVIIIQFKWNK